VTVGSFPYEAEVDAERDGWYEVLGLLRPLSPEERLVPGYYHDPDWTVRDLVAHLGTWLAQADVQFERMAGGTYQRHEIDIDAVNAALLEAMAGQPWDVAWVQANAARTRMLESLRDLREPSDDAAWWLAKCAARHYTQHVGRLREWAGELAERRAR
jgi:hypothetical protein